MEYNFREIEQKWQKFWNENKIYKTDINLNKPKFYVLDMFPYPSGAGLHVGHPLGYIASDIYSRYKRLQGYNVLHPMGYDAYGLPAEQYAIQTGQHPAVTTAKNIARYREQMDKIGFCYDWDREVRTCEPNYYKWTQWAFIQMFNSYYSLPPTPSDRGGARPITQLVEHFEKFGAENANAIGSEELSFTADEWNAKSEKEQQEILLNYRIAYLADLKVNWCPALGTVLANDEVSEGLSVRGGHPVEQKVMRQWSLRVSAYAQRLLDGLDKIDWTESLKETQKNWIGRSEGAEMRFYLSNPTLTLPQGEGGKKPQISSQEKEVGDKAPSFFTTDANSWNILKEKAKQMRHEPTDAESLLWENLRGCKLGYKFRRQQPVDIFIPDFVCTQKKLIVEVDGGYHLEKDQVEFDKERTRILEAVGYQILRFKNEEVLADVHTVLEKIRTKLNEIKENDTTPSPCGRAGQSLSPSPCGWGGVGFDIFTTRADTIFGVTFMVLAPESELVKICTTQEQAEEVQKYLDATKKRTERERIADRRVTGVFSGSYAINPVAGTEIPIYISDYVLAGYGTGAIMAVPAHDSRDYAFAKHFNLPIIPLIEGADVSKESYDAKDGIMINSGFLNGLTVKEAIAKTKEYITEKGIGKVKVNFRLRDAIFSRQRYWGEPFPVYYKDDMPYMLDESKLPLELPEIDKFLPTETGEPPLGRAKNWKYTPPQTLPVREGELDTSNSSLKQRPNYHTTDAQYWHLLIDNAKRMRQEPTEAESILWNLLRDKKTGYKFRQQHPIDIFIPDFVCLSKKLIVEIDGEYHLTEEQIKLDAERTQILEISGYKIIRFNNNEVITNPHAIVEKIKNELENRLTSSTNDDVAHSPSPLGRGGVGSYPLELNTMPGFAGSSAYYLRYMDPINSNALVSKEANEYWRNVDLYIGGTEHATGHLIYSRFWNKFLFDLGIVCEEEPFKKLINQGMIQGRSNFVYRIQGTNTFVSFNLKDKYETTPIHVDVNMVSNDVLDIERFKNWNPEYKTAEFILEYPTPALPKGEGDVGNQPPSTHTSPPLEGKEGRYVCGWAVEKMSKSMFNVVNPDDIVEKYGADTLRLYEMFLGPLEQSKPWDTNGIDGVHRFLKRLWSLFYNGDTLNISDEAPTADELKTLHKTIKKIGGDIETFSFNTSVSAFMICVNELYTLKCNKKAILEPLAIILAPFAPHVAEEMYHLLGNNSTVCDAQWPIFNEEYLKESSVKYPISFNGKVRFTLELPADMNKDDVEKTALANEQTQKHLEGKSPKKIIVVPGKIVNIVV